MERDTFASSAVAGGARLSRWSTTESFTTGSHRRTGSHYRNTSVSHNNGPSGAAANGAPISHHRQPSHFRKLSTTMSVNPVGPPPKRHSLMARYLYKKAQGLKWLYCGTQENSLSGSPNLSLGVVVRRQDGTYTSEPQSMDITVVAAVASLCVPVALTMSSEITGALIDQLGSYQKELYLGGQSGAYLPIINSVADIATGQAHVPVESHMCLCRNEGFILIWGDQVETILAQASEVESNIIGVVWGTPMTQPQVARDFRHSMTHFLKSSETAANQARLRAVMQPSHVYFYPDMDPAAPVALEDPILKEKMNVVQRAIEKEENGDKVFDPDKESQEVPKRPFLLTHAVLIGLAIVLSIVVEMACVAKMITEALLDGNYIRFALAATIPLFATFSLFFMIVTTGSLCQIMGPISGVLGNSKFYSAKAPKPGRFPDYQLPHVTIQMPVYKEGLKGVIIPTITSLLAAVKHYEAQGGTASIFVNDDGMQLVTPVLAKARQAFYDINGIGWCSRPPHCTEQGDNFFLRKGKFKKASNMNYCLDFSIRVEDEFMRLVEQVCQQRQCQRDAISLDDEDKLYEQAREAMLERDGGRTWAGGDVRMGEIILIIDSDTRVPVDCLLYGALEMYESPDVALLQHKSGILQVVNNAFENGITWFTDMVYTSIQFAVGNGDCAPFVGHNTFIRWKAIQSIAFEEDGVTKFWSDSHVSEDFDVSLRLQMNNFIVRMATYHNGDFKEGVSLTVYDELARWEKYAYGCNELVFNPLYQWIYKGPFTRLFLRFIFSNIKITTKITIFAYIGTYYAIASAIPLSLSNYLLVGWFQGDLDQFYLTSWRIFVGMAAVFNVLSPLGYAMLCHRLGQETFFKSLWKAFKWMPMFLLFFGGVSFHLLKALLCHFLSINMEWTTTAKELESSGFRVGLDRIVRDFKFMYLWVVVMVGGMVYLGIYAPYGWTITDFSAIVPIANQVACHALLPFALGLF